MRYYLFLYVSLVGKKSSPFMYLDLILNGSADLLLADFSITAERSKKGIEFSLPFMTVGHTLMGRKAETLKVNIFIL